MNALLSLLVLVVKPLCAGLLPAWAVIVPLWQPGGGAQLAEWQLREFTWDKFLLPTASTGS